MIKEIHIENFQSHKKTVCTFSPYVNNIIGSSNSGKTAILRALKWVITNRPLGDSFVSYFNKDAKQNHIRPCKVTIITDDGNVISRVKHNNNNYYELNGIKLEATGTDVPEEVQKVLNISEVNMQSQMDAPFLLSNSAGEVARFFNKIIRLDIIDKYLTVIESKKRKTKEKIKNLEEQITQNKAELKQYEWTKKAEKLLDKLKKYEENYDEYNAMLEELKSTLEIERQMKQFIRYSEKIYLDAEKLLTEINKINTTKQEKESMQNDLNTEYNSYIISQKLIDRLDFIPICEEKLYKYTKYDTDIQSKQTLHNEISSSLLQYKQYLQQTETDVDIAYCEKLCKRITAIDAQIETIKIICADLSNSKSSYVLSQETIETAEQEYTALQETLPDICPVCGQIIPHKHKESL